VRIGKLHGVFPVIAPPFPCYGEIIPCYFWPRKSPETCINAALLDDVTIISVKILGFSLYFSLLPRTLVAETGSITTASATTQSCANGDFPDQYGHQLEIDGLLQIFGQHFHYVGHRMLAPSR
jgi:hypothetical protein